MVARPDTLTETTLPVVVIVGRPNVGKSTLFNAIIGQRRSIVGDEPGITRDRIYGEFDWLGRQYRLVDTGGIVPDDPELIPTEIYNQARVALTEADALILVVDARTELASPDYDLVRLLMRSGKPLFLAVNKVEGDLMAAAAENFRQLGIRNVYAISSEHGLGIGDLLDALAEALPQAPILTPDSGLAGPGFSPDIEPAQTTRALAPEADFEEDSPDEKPLHRTHGEFEQHETSVAIIGRPNVGKSTLLNALTGTSRAIVSPIAGTTRDAVDETVTRDGRDYVFVDTAGIRRRGKTTEMAEKLSVVMARRNIRMAHVVLLVLDATEGVVSLDATIAGYAHEGGRAVIVCVNKADQLPGSKKQEFEEQIKDEFKFLDYAPVLFISAKTGAGVEKLFPLIRKVYDSASLRITTGELNRFVEQLRFEQRKIFYITQASIRPPAFVVFIDKGGPLHFSHERHLINQIRRRFGFEGTPILLKTRAKSSTPRR